MMMKWPLLVEFERDFDGSGFSTPVERLQDKAQVFPLNNTTQSARA